MTGCGVIRHFVFDQTVDYAALIHPARAHEGPTCVSVIPISSRLVRAVLLFQAVLFQAVLANIVRTPSALLIATTCDDLRPLALRTAAASGVASIDFRSD